MTTLLVQALIAQPLRSPFAGNNKLGATRFEDLVLQSQQRPRPTTREEQAREPPNSARKVLSARVRSSSLFPECNHNRNRNAVVITCQVARSLSQNASKLERYEYRIDRDRATGIVRWR